MNPPCMDKLILKRAHPNIHSYWELYHIENIVAGAPSILKMGYLVTYMVHIFHAKMYNVLAHPPSEGWEMCFTYINGLYPNIKPCVDNNIYGNVQRQHSNKYWVIISPTRREN